MAAWWDKIQLTPKYKWKRAKERFVSLPEKWELLTLVYRQTHRKTKKERKVRFYALRRPDGLMVHRANGKLYHTIDPRAAAKHAKTIARKRDKGKIKAHRAALLAILKAQAPTGKKLNVQELAKMTHRNSEDVGRDLAAMAKAGTIKGDVVKTYDVKSLGGKEFGGTVSMHRKRAHYWVEATEPPVEQLSEFRRLTGVGRSLTEKAAVDPMLAVLAKAFSVKAVKPADVKFLRYRKMGKGVELEDKAGRLGGILTSVEPKDADPKALVAFLKKHGAKVFKESLDEAK